MRQRSPCPVRSRKLSIHLVAGHGVMLQNRDPCATCTCPYFVHAFYFCVGLLHTDASHPVCLPASAARTRSSCRMRDDPCAADRPMRPSGSSNGTAHSYQCVFEMYEHSLGVLLRFFLWRGSNADALALVFLPHHSSQATAFFPLHVSPFAWDEYTACSFSFVGLFLARSPRCWAPAPTPVRAPKTTRSLRSEGSRCLHRHMIARTCPF